MRQPRSPRIQPDLQTLSDEEFHAINERRRRSGRRPWPTVAVALRRLRRPARISPATLHHWALHPDDRVLAALADRLWGDVNCECAVARDEVCHQALLRARHRRARWTALLDAILGHVRRSACPGDGSAAVRDQAQALERIFDGTCEPTDALLRLPPGYGWLIAARHARGLSEAQIGSLAEAGLVGAMLGNEAHPLATSPGTLAAGLRQLAARMGTLGTLAAAARLTSAADARGVVPPPDALREFAGAFARQGEMARAEFPEVRRFVAESRDAVASWVEACAERYSDPERRDELAALLLTAQWPEAKDAGLRIIASAA
jgi:hypothetical protein